MAVTNYSGSQRITGCTITTWTDSTYYSFKLTQECRISIGGTPAVKYNIGEEFIIQVNTPYIFDRDTTVSLSYPVVEDVVVDVEQEMLNGTERSFSVATGVYVTVATLISDRALTAYEYLAFISIYITASETGVVTRLRYDGTTIASRSDNYTAGELKSIALSGDSTVAIPKNGVVTLEVEGSGSLTYIKADWDSTIIRLTDTA